MVRPQQPQKTLADALLVDKAGRKPTVSLAVVGKSQFTWAVENGLKKGQANHACFDTAQWQTNDFLTRTFGKKAPRLDVPQTAIQVAYAEDANGRVAVDPMQGHCAALRKQLDLTNPQYQYLQAVLNAAAGALSSHLRRSLASDVQSDEVLLVAAEDEFIRLAEGGDPAWMGARDHSDGKR